MNFSIRMGMFSIKGNSERLVIRLKEFHFKTYTKDMTLNKNNVTAVHVGPMAESQTTDLRLRLAELFNLNTIIDSL